MAIRPTGRVAIIGAGNVGSAAAYALVNQNITSEILLIDIARDLAVSQGLDLEDANTFINPTKIKVADYSDLQDGDIVVIASGSAQRDGMRRLDLLNINAEIIRSVVGNIKSTGKTVYIIMVTNPVDILTYIVAKESGLPENMVMGTGTYLDTGRLQAILSKRTGVNPHDISAYVFGEHGDSSFPVLGSARVAGVQLSQILEIDDQLYDALAGEVRERAYEIIKGKKSTHFGIGAAVAAMSRMIIRNENRIIQMTAMLNGQYGFSDVCIGVTAKLGAAGYEVYREVDLTEKERGLFATSVTVLKDKFNEFKQS